MRTWALAPLILSVLSGCANSLPGGRAEAILDAMDPHLRLCAGALAGSDMPDARTACLPVFEVYQVGLNLSP